MHCGSGNCWRCYIYAGQTQSQHSPGGSIFLCEMTSWPPSWKCDIKLKIWLCQLMCILLEEHFCWISSQFDLKSQSHRLFWTGCPNKNYKKNKTSGDMRSVYVGKKYDTVTAECNTSINCFTYGSLNHRSMCYPSRKTSEFATLLYDLNMLLLTAEFTILSMIDRIR